MILYDIICTVYLQRCSTHLKLQRFVFHGAVTCEVCDPDWDRAKERKEKILAMIKGQERDEDEDPRGSWKIPISLSFLEKMVENNGKKHGTTEVNNHIITTSNSENNMIMLMIIW